MGANRPTTLMIAPLCCECIIRRECGNLDPSSYIYSTVSAIHHHAIPVTIAITQVSGSLHTAPEYPHRKGSVAHSSWLN